MFVVVVVWFCCSSWLAFLILTYYCNLMHQFLLHWVICFGGYLIVHTEFFEKDLDFFGIRKKYFLGFSICSSFGRQLCQNCGWAGSEPYSPSHITEPPCSLKGQLFELLLYFLKKKHKEFLGLLFRKLNKCGYQKIWVLFIDTSRFVHFDIHFIIVMS